jgi:hypothetical protein
MSKEFIVETAQIKKAVGLINELEEKKFSLLIQRIVQKLHNSESSFKADEFERLEKSFQLSNEDCRLVIDILEFIYLQAAYELVKSNVLHVHLVKINLHGDKANAVAELWKESGKEIIDRIRQAKSMATKRLLSVKWRLDMNLASEVRTRQKHASALFEFRIESADETNVQLEFAKEELYEFYSQLEVIQRQIDALNG